MKRGLVGTGLKEGEGGAISRKHTRTAKQVVERVRMAWGAQGEGGVQGARAGGGTMRARHQQQTIKEVGRAGSYVKLQGSWVGACLPGKAAAVAARSGKAELCGHRGPSVNGGSRGERIRV